MARRRRRLRVRLTAAFALVGLVIPASLSIFTYYWSRTYLLDNRQNSAVHQAQANAQLVAELLRASKPEVSRLVQSLQTPSDAQPLVLYQGSWFGTSAVAGPDALPSELVGAVAHGEAGRQRYHRRSGQELAVGIPLAGGNAYFQIFSLAGLNSTLGTLRDSLVAGSLLSFVISVALGAWATSRVLRPVRDIGQAAASIAAGRLDARLDAEGDRELVELATGFNAMVQSLESRIERDARFASDVSHELRSPLTTLQSAVEVMRNRRDELPERSRRAFDLLSDEVVRFERLVEDLLEISRYDAGAARLDLEPVDVAALTRGLLAEAKQEAEMDLPPDVQSPILADRRRLEQSLRNLIRNAIVHGGGVTRAAVATVAGRTVIAIEDRGPGIPTADKESIFERFARGRAAGRRSSGQGVGLGLALVAEHIGLQGGSVMVEDVEPHGSRFVIDLPARRP
ncbi:MAG TPA: HAMP domain-containing sensor histidine kinase [Acidimicrobiales bacterium]|nr:HAMP domain-containing sensor histidine kinase [Acidimicrobiales bacterium]